MSNTKVFHVNEKNIDLETINKAANVIADGGTCVFPTETVYGLGADARRDDAAKKIYAAKNRPGDNPLIVHVATEEMLRDLIVEENVRFEKLKNAFWPGPLTMIIKKTSKIPYTVTSGLDTVAIRWPSNKVAQELIKLSNCPIAAPSANISGKPSPTTGQDVLEDLKDKVDCILISDQSDVGLESTVVDMTRETITILRPGFITATDIEEVLNEKVIVQKSMHDKEAPKSPGMKYRHYAPKAQMLIVDGKVSKEVQATILEIAKEKSQDYKVGILAFSECEEYSFYNVKYLSRDRNAIEAGKNLFSTLREFDREGVTFVLAEAITGDGFEMAIMNRLIKAAGNKIKIL